MLCCAVLCGDLPAQPSALQRGGQASKLRMAQRSCRPTRSTRWLAASRQVWHSRQRSTATDHRSLEWRIDDARGPQYQVASIIVTISAQPPALQRSQRPETKMVPQISQATSLQHWSSECIKQQGCSIQTDTCTCIQPWGLKIGVPRTSLRTTQPTKSP